MSHFGQDDESRYLALLADLVGSRRVDDRAAVQSRMLETVETLNGRYADDLAAPLAVSRGDEVQGLFARRDAVVPVVVELADALHPVEWCCGVGWGGLSTPLGDAVVRLDGPAFHCARSALERAQGDGRWLAVEGIGSATGQVLESLFVLMQALRRRWTDRQIEFIREARGALQKDVAARFDVSPSTVSESLKAAGFAAVQEGEAAAAALLSRFGREGEASASSPSPPKRTEGAP